MLMPPSSCRERGVVREGTPAWCSGFSLVARATSLSASVARLSRISSRFDTKKTEAEGCLHEETSIWHEAREVQCIYFVRKMHSCHAWSWAVR